MKKVIVLALSLMAVSATGAMAQSKAPAKAAQENAVTNGAVISFEEEKFDFGDITQGDVVEHVFKFKNTGNQPLVLSNVATTCGCTATDWPRDPIMPGKSGTIKAQFNSAGKLYQQNKVITVYSNATNGESRVSIVTNILPKDQPRTQATPVQNGHEGHNHGTEVKATPTTPATPAAPASKASKRSKR